jgi:hypothetical protein
VEADEIFERRSHIWGLMKSQVELGGADRDLHQSFFCF